MYRIRLRLTIVMIVFAVVISLVNTIVDYNRLKEQAIQNNQFQVLQIEETIVHLIESIEKAYALFEQNTTLDMENSTSYLMNLYKQNPSFHDWDFKALKELLGFDIYIINKNNVITHSSFEEDIGLDFNACCATLAKILDERRNSGDLYVDGMDVEQKTGTIKKYSYMATPDKEHLIELGLSLQDGPIFKEFNFLQVKQEMEKKYSSINEINILNLGGITLGLSGDEDKLTGERREAFETTLRTGKVNEVRKQSVIYRYVPYVSAFDIGSTKTKVIEIIYNQEGLQSLLHNNYKTFLGQFFIVLIVTVIIAFLISSWISKPMYLAFHDSLTGLKNRAAFDELLHKKMLENKGTLALMIIDLDDFKLVNDTFGHNMGDQLLKQFAKRMLEVIRPEDIAVRLGGDEFVLIMPSTNKEEVERTANVMIEVVEETVNQLDGVEGITSASIGIALAPEHGNEPDQLFKYADRALYLSKNKGKNQYHFYK